MPGHYAPPGAAQFPESRIENPRNPVRGADPRFAAPAARRPGRPCKQGLPAFCGSAAEGDSISFCAAVKAALSVSSYYLSHLTLMSRLSRHLMPTLSVFFIHAPREAWRAPRRRRRMVRP